MCQHRASLNRLWHLLVSEAGKELSDYSCGGEFRPYVTPRTIAKSLDVKLYAEVHLPRKYNARKRENSPLLQGSKSQWVNREEAGLVLSSLHH